MPIDYKRMLQIRNYNQPFSYSDRDTMLYALAIGLGSDPANERELEFVYENGLNAIPTLATVIAWGAGVSTEKLGLDYKLVLHGEEHTIFHRSVPSSGIILADSSIREIYDKGPGKGAIVVRETVLRDANDKHPIATLRRSLFARGDGGFGGSAQARSAPDSRPDREADTVLTYRTTPNQAAIYRLCGDRNPLHISPAHARAAGFDRPILHGLCTYGMACRAVLEAFCDFDPAAIASHQARFSSPMFPGESLQIRLWKDGDTISFEAEAVERSVTVIKNGQTVLR